MGSSISINGMRIETNNDGSIVINGPQAKQEKVVIDKNGNINGDVTGGIEIKGSNITLVIKGDVTGNIVGDCKIQVDGDITGNVVGGRVNRG